MTDSKKDLKAIRLDETIGSVTPEKLEATRKHVTSEIESSHARHVAKSADEPIVSLDTLSSAAPTPSPTIPPPASSADDERLRKLDLITDVQLVLVDKYRRAANLLWVAIGLLVLSFMSLSAGVFVGLDMQKQIKMLASEQQDVLNEQQAAKKAAEETKQEVVAAKLAVNETQKKVDEAAESSPKIEVDEAGKARVVVTVKKAPPSSSGSPAPPSMRPPPSGALPVEFKEETKKH